MKDIKNEVRALEVAMQVATDIKDKPYAYVVARIQEAILGKSEIEPEAAKEPKWSVKVTKGTNNSHWLRISHPEFVYASMIIPEKTIPIANSFCQDMENLQLGSKDKVSRRWDLDTREVTVVFNYSSDGFRTHNCFTLERVTPGDKVILDNLSQDLIHLQSTSE